MEPVCAQVPYYMFVHHRHKMETMTSVWFFPVVPGVVAALSAAIVGKVVDPRSAAQVRRPQASADCYLESWEKLIHAALQFKAKNAHCGMSHNETSI